jgi:hypothetical protein
MLDSYSADAIGWMEPQATPAGEQTGQMRFMPEKLDSDYMKAVESGDVETQQRMVDEAAKMAGWNVIPVSHGSGAQFNEFKREFLGTATGGKSANEAFFFTNSPKTSRNYATYAAEEGPIKELLRKADEAEKKGDWDAYEKFLTEAEDASYGELGAESAAKRREKAKVYNVYLKGKFMELDAEGKTPEELSATKDLSEFDGSLTAAIKKAKKDGYDGVVFRNLDDAPNISDPSDHYAVIDPKAIKLSDPITRDDSGNVIPLSKRFDVGSRDMRYMPEGDNVPNRQKISTKKQPSKLPSRSRIAAVNEDEEQSRRPKRRSTAKGNASAIANAAKLK